MIAHDIAQVCHEANRTLQIIQNDMGIPVSEPWETLDHETRESAVTGVEDILNGTVITPVQSHENWMKFKADHGWVFGIIKDDVRKQHPCMVPYEELPADQKIKDALFFAIVRALGWRAFRDRREQ